MFCIKRVCFLHIHLIGFYMKSTRRQEVNEPKGLRGLRFNVKTRLTDFRV